MSTSLKIQYANEIAEAMAEALGEKFEKVAFDKEATEAYSQLMALLPRAEDGMSIMALWKKFGPMLSGAEKESAEEAVNAQHVKVTGRNMPGFGVPADDAEQAAEGGCEKCKAEPCACMADDVQEADTCELCGQKKPEKSDLDVPEDPGAEAEPAAWDGPEAIAADFAMKHLVNVADALDGKGFKDVANLVDEALQKLAAKK